MSAWLGEWRLIPELSHYDAGDPPDSGRYRISVADGLVRFDVEWSAEGEDHSVSFSGPPDGTPVSAATSGVDSFTVTAVDDSTLDSEAVAGSRRVAWARRRVSADGTLMSVIQRLAGPDGEVTVFQVYRRKEGGA